MTQEQTDDQLLGMFENYTENPEQIRVNLPFTTDQQTLKGILEFTYQITDEIHAILLDTDKADHKYTLTFIYSGVRLSPSEVRKPSPRLSTWAKDTAKAVKSEMLPDKINKAPKSFGTFIPSPDALKSSCLLVSPSDRPETLRLILSALYRKYRTVTEPGIVTCRDKNGKETSFLKTRVSCAKNTGYGNTPLSSERSKQVSDLIRQITGKRIRKSCKTNNLKAKKGGRHKL